MLLPWSPSYRRTRLKGEPSFFIRFTFFIIIFTEGKKLSIESLIKNEEFFHHFQPIYCLENMGIVGFEGLLRSQKHPSPQEMFKIAKSGNMLYELDSRSIHKAIKTYSNTGFSKKDGKLFLNILPSTILHENFSYFISKILEANYHINQDIVLEISETEEMIDFKQFKQKVLELKKHGILLALDDIGAGYFNIRAIIELQPDYLKLDRYLSISLLESNEKQSVISYFLDYVEKYMNKTHIILEGLETEDEMMVAKSLGISVAQGFLLGKPALLEDITQTRINYENSINS